MGKINSNYNYSYTIIRDTLDSVKAALATVDSALSTIDDAITSINTALDGKQATLVSGTNIKTINNGSILGEGNIALQEPIIAGTGITIGADGKTISASGGNLYIHNLHFDFVNPVSERNTIVDIKVLSKENSSLVNATLMSIADLLYTSIFGLDDLGNLITSVSDDSSGFVFNSSTAIIVAPKSTIITTDAVSEVI